MSAEALRVPPHSVDAEQSILGGLLLDNGAWERLDGRVTVVPLVQAINVSPTSVSVDEGATQALTASVSPSGAASGLVYESASPAVATLGNVGLVTGVAEGTTTVKITSAARPSVSVTVPVTVTAP